MGVQLRDSDENEIVNNIIHRTVNHVLSIENSYENNILSNSFTFDNNFKANWIFSVNSDNIWDSNYWGRGRIVPKLILVRKYVNDILWVPDFDIDWHPAKEPCHI